MIAASHAVADFIAAMEASGLRPVDPIAPKLAAGGLVRFRSEGDGPGRLNSWAVIHLDGVPAGRFGNWRLGVEEKWRADAPTVRLTSAERDSRQREWNLAKAAKERARQAGYVKAAKAAEALWEAASVDCADHPYLVGKRLNPPGLRVHGDTLLVPMRDHAGNLWNLQGIGPDGRKRFRSGARVDGLAFHIGEPGLVLTIGEGMATMAAVHAATGLPVFAAMMRSNLALIARNLRTRYGPGATLILCADDDAHLSPNVGTEAANAAARACGGLVARPPRPVGWPESKGWDFADTWAAPDGAALIRAALALNDGGAA